MLLNLARLSILAALAAVAALLAPGVFAHEVKDEKKESLEIEEVVVEGRQENLAGETRSASEGVIGQSELRNRPLLRPGDVMESIPNLIMTQHSSNSSMTGLFTVVTGIASG